MQTIKTSFYMNYEAIKKSGLMPVSISRGFPRWKLPYNVDYKIHELAPGKEFSNADVVDFISNYSRLLDEYVTLELVKTRLKECEEFAPKGIVLLCFCKPDPLSGSVFCHRRIFADWWERKTGKRVTEL